MTKIVLTWRNPTLQFTEGHSYLVGALARALLIIRSDLDIDVRILCTKTVSHKSPNNECTYSIVLPASTDSLLKGVTISSIMASSLELLFSSIVIFSNTHGKKIIIVGNSFKGVSQLARGEINNILMLLHRYQLKSPILRFLRFNTTITFSRELELLAQKYFGIKTKSLFLFYPPIDLELYKPSTKRRDSFLSYFGAEHIITYIGRLNELRFPLSFFSLLVKNIKEVPDAKIVIIGFPDYASIQWKKVAQKIVEKANSGNKVLITLEKLDLHRKALVLSASKAFIYLPKTHCATEPPISILEAVASGATIITTGLDSTREIALHTHGI